MPQRKSIALFFCRFVLLYLVLVIPWPGWERIYGNGFRAVGRILFASKSGLRELTFGPLGQAPHPWYTRIVIVNRNMIHADGSGPVRNFDLDALAFGWKPAALLLALVVATPISWRRRGWALLWGLLAIHAIILLFLGFSIWNESTEVSLVVLSPFWKQTADAIKDFVLSQYSVVMPLVAWILVTFRMEDRTGPVGLSLFGPAGGKDGAGEKETARARKAAGK
jgi:hypothetical protein